MKSTFKVTYSGTRKFNTYPTKKAAIDQAKWAIGIGNMQSCVHKKLPSGKWQKVKCLNRRRGRRS